MTAHFTPILSTTTDATTATQRLQDAVDAAQRRYDATRSHRAWVALYVARHVLLAAEVGKSDG